MLLLLLACHAPVEDPSPPADSAPADSATDTADTADTGDTADTAAPSRCPTGMVDLGALCMDAVEVSVVGELGHADQGTAWPDGSTTATSRAVPYAVPDAHVSWYQAVAICANTGAHLCTWDEWRDACDGVPGDGGSTYPWGEEPSPEGRCALADADGTTDFDGAQPAGSMAGCTGANGVYDQIGNLWEWVDLGEVGPDGRPVAGKVGGAWYAGYGNGLCPAAPSTEHGPEFEGSIGFRCCVAPG